MKAHRAWTIGAAAALLAIAAAFVFYPSQSAGPPPEENAQAPATSELRHETPASPTATTDSADNAEPTIPRAIAELVVRAGAGDAKAACQLGFELLRCHEGARAFDRTMLKLLAEDERTNEANGDLAAANKLAEQQALQLVRAQACRDIPANLRGRGSYYLRQSALAGDPSGMLAYGLGYQFSPSGRGMLVDPTFEAWREEAPLMLERALFAGQPSAASTLAWGYRDDSGHPSSLIPDDPYRAAVYHLLWTRLFRRSEQHAWLGKLAPEELRSARLEAERLHSDAFDGRRYDSNETHAYPPYLSHPSHSRPPCELPQ